jgi:hypothetical protein
MFTLKQSVNTYMGVSNSFALLSLKIIEIYMVT